MSLGLQAQQWKAMNNNVTLPTTSAVLVLYGSSTENSTKAYFTIDGERDYKVEHHYQTSNLTTFTDTIISTRNYNLFHINWGRGGKGDGWYSKGVYTPKDTPNNTYILNYYTTISRR
jgi:6-phosphogluconate dehydrogenase